MEELTVMECSALIDFIENNDICYFRDVCEEGSVSANELLRKLKSLAGSE